MLQVYMCYFASLSCSFTMIDWLMIMFQTTAVPHALITWYWREKYTLKLAYFLKHIPLSPYQVFLLISIRIEFRHCWIGKISFFPVVYSVCIYLLSRVIALTNASCRLHLFIVFWGLNLCLVTVCHQKLVFSLLSLDNLIYWSVAPVVPRTRCSKKHVCSKLHFYPILVQKGFR